MAGVARYGIVVFKLGGSLLSCVDLAARLRAVLRQRPDSHALIVVGGGATADIVRDWSRLHSLSNEAAHWLAVRSLSLNRAVLRRLLPESDEVSSLAAATARWREANVPLLVDVETTLREAESQDAAPLPHSWDVTSDSIAAWNANRWTAHELVLLKSTDLPTGVDLDQAAQRGLVDRYFAQVASDVARVSWCNLRDDDSSITPWLKYGRLVQ